MDADVRRPHSRLDRKSREVLHVVLSCYRMVRAEPQSVTFETDDSISLHGVIDALIIYTHEREREGKNRVLATTSLTSSEVLFLSK